MGCFRTNVPEESFFKKFKLAVDFDNILSDNRDRIIGFKAEKYMKMSFRFSLHFQNVIVSSLLGFETQIPSLSTEYYFNLLKKIITD